jgi:hypothetical protein
MPATNVAPQKGNYEKTYTAAIFDAEAMKKAKEMFEEYRTSGIILNDCFSDKEWRLTNQLHNLTIDFRFDELGYSKNTKPWIGCKSDSFIDCVKAYAIFTLGSLTLLTIREIVNSFRLFTAMAEDKLIGAASEYISHMVALLAILPGESVKRDAVIEALEEKQLYSPRQTGKARQRVLSELGTYFKFNDAIQGLWASASDKEKLFWLPLYLW